MKSNHRTQVERSEATRGALTSAARQLIAQRGYASVGTPEIARAAGVTRGALYHQFADKRSLFAAVTEAVERDTTERLLAAISARAPSDPLAALHLAIDAWLDACEDQEVRQILLTDAPNVLGWEAFRDLAASYRLGLTEQLLTAAMDTGLLPALPVSAFAHVLLGALQEVAFAVAAEPAAKDDTRQVLHHLIDALSERPRQQPNRFSPADGQ